MPNIEFAVPHSLVTPFGTLAFNEVDPVTRRVYQIQSNGYKMVPSMRITQDNISQMDGSVLHPRYKTGVVLTARVTYELGVGTDAERNPACATDLREMHEFFTGCLNSILDYDGGTDQRLFWTPSGYGDQRLLDAIETLNWLDPSLEENTPIWGVDFAIESPFPYAIDNTQVSTSLTGTTTITNAGNSKTYPVFKVNGFSAGFVITNVTTGFAIVYNTGLPGSVSIPGGHFGEIDCFRGTIFQDGNGADLIAAIDPTQSDFFPLVPGANQISITGATATMLWNNAWA